MCAITRAVIVKLCELKEEHNCKSHLYLLLILDPSAVVNVTVSNIATVTADVSWTKGSGGVDHFEVRHELLGDREYRAEIPITASRDMTDYGYHLTGLTPGYAHHFTVTAYKNGFMSKSKEFTVITCE